jgi:NADPH-dependent ferric siderophore reductase
MNKEDADALLINIQTTSNKKARVHELGNGDHVVILKAQNWHLWSAEDWYSFLAAEAKANKEVEKEVELVAS